MKSLTREQDKRIAEILFPMRKNRYTLCLLKELSSDPEAARETVLNPDFLSFFF